MQFDLDSTYYDVLEVSPDATTQEIREAYFRAKSAYKKDSIALYSLMSAEETREILDQIEIAYNVLSNPEKRKQYDAHHGILRAGLPTSSHEKVISIDRYPPMDPLDGSSSAEDILVAPRTDFDARSGSIRPDDVSHESAADADPFGAPAPRETRRPLPRALAQPTTKINTGNELDPAMEREIDMEAEWSGPFLRRIREAKNISVEEMANFTKLSKTYITAIEEENFAKLPAAVYLRGFVTLIAKGLGLDHDKVTPAYMTRYQNKPSSDKERE